MELFCTLSFRCNTVVSGRQISTDVSGVSAAFIMKLFIHRVDTGSKSFRYFGTHLPHYTASPPTSKFFIHYFVIFKSHSSWIHLAQDRVQCLERVQHIRIFLSSRMIFTDVSVLQAVCQNVKGQCLEDRIDISSRNVCN